MLTTRQRTVQRACLLAVVILAAGLRVYRLKDVPAGFFCDEAALGYNAYAIATAGVGETGQRLPLFFWSFDLMYRPPVFIYAAAIPVKLLGLDEFSVRLTSALFGTGTVIGTFFLARALSTPWVGLAAAALLAICPWHLHFSRIAFELISFPFLFVIGVTLLVRFTQGRRTLPAAVLFCGLCVYAYAVATLFVPLFLAGFAALYARTLWRRWRETLLAAAVLAATVAPAGVFLYVHQPKSTQYFRNATNLHPGEDLWTQAQRLGRDYLEFFSPAFLFERGDPIVVRHGVRDFGELLPWYAPFLLLGVAVLALRPDRPSKLALWWLALYPVGPSLMAEIPSASRGIIGVPAFCLVTAVGLGTALRWVGSLSRRRLPAPALQGAALAIASCLLVPEVQRYLAAYFVDYAKYSAPTFRGFQYGYREAIRYMETQRSRYDLLVISDRDNQPQIFPLFYNRIDPRAWSAQHDPGYAVLDLALVRLLPPNARILALLQPWDLGLVSEHTIQRTIVVPGGDVALIIAEVRAPRDLSP